MTPTRKEPLFGSLELAIDLVSREVIVNSWKYANTCLMRLDSGNPEKFCSIMYIRKNYIWKISSFSSEGIRSNQIVRSRSISGSVHKRIDKCHEMLLELVIRKWIKRTSRWCCGARCSPKERRLSRQVVWSRRSRKGRPFSRSSRLNPERRSRPLGSKPQKESRGWCGWDRRWGICRRLSNSASHRSS